jgi:hypothetical protein
MLNPDGTPQTPETPSGTLPPQGAAPTEFEVTVAGQVKKMTIDQLKQAASKAEGADEKFRIAAAAVKTQELVKTMLNSPTGLDYEDAVVLAQNVGGNPEDYMFEQEAPTLQTPPARVPQAQTFNTLPVSTGLSAEDMEDLAYARSQRMEGYITKVKGDIKNTLDKDTQISTLMGKVPEAQKAGLQEVLSEMVYEEVSRRVGMSRQTYGPSLVQDVIQKVASRVNKLGLPTAGRQETNMLEFPISGLGPITGMSNSELMSDKPIERVSSNDGNYSDNFVARFAKKLAQATTNRR